MCDFCTAATVGEAERFYELLKKGKVKAAMPHVLGDGSPRADLRARQTEELKLGAFADAPAFEADLRRLCEDFGTPNWNTLAEVLFLSEPRFGVSVLKQSFEAALVALRKRHGRPVLSEADVAFLIETSRTEVGVPPLQETFGAILAEMPPQPNGDFDDRLRVVARTFE